MIAALLLAINLLQYWRDTNSHAANAHGVEAFARQKYADAVAAFRKEKSSAAAHFNLGTAQIAAGKREQGSQTIAKAFDDPALRGAALYNRGESALEAKAYDHAIHDFTEALKANPSDGGAKRNLEIALARKLAAQQKAGARNDQGGTQPSPAPQPSAQAEQPKRDANAEALLRSVQQQEQEELQRMHRPRSDRIHVGW